MAQLTKTDSNWNLSLDNNDNEIILETAGTYLDKNIKISVSNNSIPSGVIMLWSGLSSNIPEGYVLCDGNNGTPDLTDKFIIGAGSSYSVGETGGAKTHNHLYKVGYRPYYGVLTGDDDTAIQAYDYESGNWVNSTQVSTGESTRVNNGIISGQWSDTTPVAEQAEGKSSITSNMPPYYSLCYIMKI